MKILGARLFAMERERLENERVERRRALIGGTPGARSDRIRTYNYPQDRVTGACDARGPGLVASLPRRLCFPFVTVSRAPAADHRIGMKYSLADVVIAGDSLKALIGNLHQFFNIEELMADVEESEAEERPAASK